MLSKWITNLKGPIYYSAGPPGMVAAMRQMLTDSGIGDDDIRTEEFTGY
jgi:ferredoxin-NADP reductase